MAKDVKKENNTATAGGLGEIATTINYGPVDANKTPE